MSLHFEHGGDIAHQQGERGNFTGTAYFQPVATNEACQLGANWVNFEKGARTFWHVHSGEQVPYFLKGRGRVQESREQGAGCSRGRRSAYTTGHPTLTQVQPRRRARHAAYHYHLWSDNLVRAGIRRGVSCGLTVLLGAK